MALDPHSGPRPRPAQTTTPPTGATVGASLAEPAVATAVDEVVP